MDSPCAALIDSGTSQILIPISSVLELSRVAEKCAKEGSALASKDALSAYLPSDIERILYSGTYEQKDIFALHAVKNQYVMFSFSDRS